MTASFAFAGSGEVDPTNAAALLDDLLPEDEDDGTPGIGSLYRPARVPRSASGLKAAVQWVETELGKRAIKSSDDLVASLLERREDKGEEVTLVMVWRDKPGDESSDDDKKMWEEDAALVLSAREAGIPVKNLASALDDLLWEPEPETPEEPEEPEVTEEPQPEAFDPAAFQREVRPSPESSQAALALALLGPLEDWVRSIARDEFARQQALAGAVQDVKASKESSKTASATPWVVWSQDDRTGTWMEIFEGTVSEADDKVTSMRETALEHNMEIHVQALPKGKTPKPAKTASKAEVAKVAAKLAEKPEEIPDDPSATKKDDDELEALPPFDPPFKSSPAGKADDRKPYFMSEDGKYRPAKNRPRRGDKRVMLSPEEVDDLVESGHMLDK